MRLLLLAFMGLILSINVRALPAERIQNPSPASPVSHLPFLREGRGESEMALGAKAISQTPTGTQLVQQGTSLYEAGKFQEAAIVWQQAASAFQKQGDTLNQAMALSNLSLTYQQVGEWQKAAQSIEESLKLLPASQGASAEELRVIAQTRDIEGNLQLAVGQAEKALATWQQTASIYDKLGWEEGKNQSWLNQARALEDLGLYPRAGETLLQLFGREAQQCVSVTKLSQLSAAQGECLLKQLSDSPSPIKAVALRSLGDILRQLGNLDLSKTVLERSLSWAETPQDKIAVKLSLGNTERALAGKNRDGKLEEQKVYEVVEDLYNPAFNLYEEVAGKSPAPLTRIQARLAHLNMVLQSSGLLGTLRFNRKLAIAVAFRQERTLYQPSLLSVGAGSPTTFTSQRKPT